MATKKHAPLPPFAEVCELLDYDPETGKLTWLSDRNFNVRAGDEAGTAIQRPHGYKVLSIYGRNYKAHRICWLLATGRDPGPLEVIHLNEDCSDNRIENLRAVEPSVRRINPCTPKTSSSGFAGVSWDGRSGKWRARLRVFGKSYSLGLYDSKENAIRCVEQARSEMIKRARHGGSS